MELSVSARSKLNDPIGIERREQWFARLQSVFDRSYTGTPPSVSGICGWPDNGALLYSDPESWVAECLENLAGQIGQYDDAERFVPYCVQYDAYGVHFIDKIFGAHVYYNEDSYQWYNDYLDTEVGSLQYPDLDNCETWQTAKRAAYAFLKQDVALPLFGLPTIASALNIAVNLYGERVLVEMPAQPSAAAHDRSVINQLLKDIHRWYRSVLPEKQLQPVIPRERAQPPGYGQLCGCTTQLVSADTYQKLAAPLDNELLGVYEHGGMIHLCGSHSHLIPVFRSMPNLKAVQINDRAALDLELYFAGLREDQIIYLMPCEGMTAETAMRISGGKKLVIIDKVK